jgi:hypothetical protein
MSCPTDVERRLGVAGSGVPALPGLLFLDLESRQGFSGGTPLPLFGIRARRGNDENGWELWDQGKEGIRLGEDVWRKACSPLGSFRFQQWLGLVK